MDAAVRARFEELVSAECGSVLRAAERVTRRRDAAEDASQEALLAALRQGARVLDARHPARWLRWLATRHACAELRARRRDRTDDAAAREGSALDVNVERRDEAARVTRELATLPREWADALRLRFDEGLTYSEIAARLGVAEATAHARVRRGLEALRERLTRQRGLSAWWAMLVRMPRALVPLAGAAGVLVFVGAGTSSESLAELSPMSAHGAPTPGNDTAAASTPTPTAEFDVAAFARRVPLSAYLDAGGTLPPQSSLPPTAATAALHGRAFDVRGRTLSGAVIELRRAVEDFEFTLCVASTMTDASGDFTLDDAPAGEHLTLVVRWANAALDERALTLAPHERRDLGALVAPVRVDESQGEFTLDVTLRDATGAPLSDAIVVLSRVQRDACGDATLSRESAGRTDSEGRIRLDGHWLGAKRVEMIGRESANSIDVSLDRPGKHSLTYTLPPPPTD